MLHEHPRRIPATYVSREIECACEVSRSHRANTPAPLHPRLRILPPHNRWHLAHLRTPSLAIASASTTPSSNSSTDYYHQVRPLAHEQRREVRRVAHDRHPTYVLPLMV